MRVLVTGAAGFIGSNFVRKAIVNTYPGLVDAEITVLDKLTYAGNLENLAPVADSPRYRFVEGDICDGELLAELMPGHEAVVHFAAESHVDRSITGAADFVITNVLRHFPTKHNVRIGCCVWIDVLYLRCRSAVIER